MFYDIAHGWRERRNESHSGIRLFVPDKSPRPEGSVRCIVLHQWGPPQATLSRQALGRIHRGERSESEEWARRMLRVPYHFGAAVTSQGKPVVCRAWPGEAYTNHCGAHNRDSIGIGIVGHFPRFAKPGDHPHPAELASAVDMAVRRAVAEVNRMDPHARHAQHCPAPVLLLTHSQFSTKSADPGERILQGLAGPLREGLIRIEPDHTEGRGTPWPQRWRQAAAGL